MRCLLQDFRLTAEIGLVAAVLSIEKTTRQPLHQQFEKR